jgi:hypothetical protein
VEGRRRGVGMVAAGGNALVTAKRGEVHVGGVETGVVEGYEVEVALLFDA